jgi:hypothetical protein
MFSVSKYIALFFGFLAAVASVFGFYQKARRESEKRRGVEDARKIEHAATDALTEGLIREENELALARARRDERLRDSASKS